MSMNPICGQLARDDPKKPCYIAQTLSQSASYTQSIALSDRRITNTDRRTRQLELQQREAQMQKDTQKEKTKQVEKSKVFEL